MTDVEEYSVESAAAAADRGELAAWVAAFLASPGSDNAPLAEILSERLCCWIGPLPLPLDRLHRLAGPPDAPALVPVDEQYWDERVDAMARCVQDGWEPPPVVVSFDGDKLALEDGNHRVESLRRAGRDHAWAVVGFETPEERDRFHVPPPP